MPVLNPIVGGGGNWGLTRTDVWGGALRPFWVKSPVMRIPPSSGRKIMTLLYCLHQIEINVLVSYILISNKFLHIK